MQALKQKIIHFQIRMATVYHSLICKATENFNNKSCIELMYLLQ